VVRINLPKLVKDTLELNAQSEPKDVYRVSQIYTGHEKLELSVECFSRFISILDTYQSTGATIHHSSRVNVTFSDK